MSSEIGLVFQVIMKKSEENILTFRQQLHEVLQENRKSMVTQLVNVDRGETLSTVNECEHNKFQGSTMPWRCRCHSRSSFPNPEYLARCLGQFRLIISAIIGMYFQ